MDKSDYFRVLGLKPSSSHEEVRKAYRIKARKYHPDVNRSPGAADMFIEASEAYEFICHHFKNLEETEARKDEIYREWIRFRQDQARERAIRHARLKFSQFKASGYYKTSSSLDKWPILYNLAISLLIIFASVNGYIHRLRMVEEGFDRPTVMGFLSLLIIGLVFFTISLIYLIAYYQITKKRGSFPYEKNKKSI